MSQEIYHAVKQFDPGPVPPGTLAGFTGAGGAPVAAESLDIIYQVVESYGKYPGGDLAAATRKPGTPWETLARQAQLGAAIPHALLQAYYSKLLVAAPPVTLH